MRWSRAENWDEWHHLARRAASRLLVQIHQGRFVGPEAETLLVELIKHAAMAAIRIDRHPAGPAQEMTDE